MVEFSTNFCYIERKKQAYAAKKEVNFMEFSSRMSRRISYPYLYVFYQNHFRPYLLSKKFAKDTETGKKVCWFLSRIPFYQEKGCTLSQAIDFAIDDCLMEEIFYSLFFYRREEIKKMLLAQFLSSALCRSTD